MKLAGFSTSNKDHSSTALSYKGSQGRHLLYSTLLYEQPERSRSHLLTISLISDGWKSAWNILCLFLWLLFFVVYACFCSGSLHGALEEKTDAPQLHLGPDRLWRGGGGELKPKMTFLYTPKFTSMDLWLKSFQHFRKHFSWNYIAYPPISLLMLNKMLRKRMKEMKRSANCKQLSNRNNVMPSIHPSVTGSWVPQF